MKCVTMQGKTTEEAITLALSELKMTRDNVEIKIMDEGSKGFMGLFGKKDAVVKVFPKFDPITSTKEIVLEYLTNMSVSSELKITKQSDSHILVELSTGDLSFLIGKHGSTLEALEHLINLAINRKSPYHLYITLDIGGYLEKRKETLERLAHNIALKVKQTKKNYVFEPMKSSERKIIHTTLQGMKNIKTTSIGEDPDRKIVVEYVN